MALYTSLASLSQTAASNAADGSVDAPSTIDQQTNLLASFIAQLRDGNGQTFALGDRNLLVNSNFAVNQRVYVSGTATTGASQGTLDRWRVVTSGQNITFGSAVPDRTVTCPAGGLEQVIEAGWIAGGVYTLSWTGTATATVNGSAITSGGQTASLTANTAVTVKFSNGTVVNAQFELGTAATLYQRRPPGTEMALCQRDYAKSYALGTTPGTATSAGAVSMSSAVGGTIIGNFRFPVPMRSTATSLNVWTTGGGANQFAAYTAGGAVTAYAATLSATESSLRVAVTIAAGEIWAEGQWVAATGF
jgi:hypothetical protein